MESILKEGKLTLKSRGKVLSLFRFRKNRIFHIPHLKLFSSLKGEIYLTFIVFFILRGYLRRLCGIRNNVEYEDN